MSCAASLYEKHILVPWKECDRTGPRIPAIDNGFPQEEAMQTWKIYEQMIPGRIPPDNTMLSDANLFYIMADPSIKPTVCGKKWPADFTNRGHVRPERVPKGPAIWVRIDNTYYYATLDAWLQGQRPGREFPRQRWHLPAVLPLYPREQRNKRQFYENYPNQFTTTSSEPSTRRITVGRIARLARGEISIDCELANREKVTQLVKAAKALESQINALRSWTSVG